MLHKGKPRIFDASKSASNSRTSSTFTTNSSGNPHSTRKTLHSKSTYFYRWGIPSICTLALLFGGIVIFNPTLDNKAYAVTDNTAIDNPAGCSTDSSNTAACIKLIVAPNKDDSTNSSITIGEPAYFSSTITVGGNHISNYSLTLNTASGSNGNLVGETNSYATVGKVGNNTSPANFPDNTWGYAISAVNTTPDKAGLTYNPVPGTDSNNSAFLDYQKDLSGTINNTYKLVFAAKLGNTMPSDKYTTNIYISAVASATETVENWFRNAGITTMQQMNSTLCKSAPENATSQLRDERDGKLYWVTKLKDNNCWMTQNLDYDGGGIKISSIQEWTNTIDTAEGNVLLSTQAYYNPGVFYYNGPDNNHTRQEVCHNTTGLYDCVGTGEAQGFSRTGSDDHYLVGNYYSWPAAMNNICPDGWTLPTSTSSKGFEALLKAYGWKNINSSPIDAIGKGGIYGDPLYLTYAGHINNGNLYAGAYGRYWSSTPRLENYRNAGAYYLTLENRVNPDSYDYRYYGFSVRCVAK